MSKKSFILPTILTAGSGGEGTVIGGGTGQGGSDAVPCSYETWLTTPWASDILTDGVINESDYATWWESNGFSKAAWEELNPGLDWEDYFD